MSSPRSTTATRAVSAVAAAALALALTGTPEPAGASPLLSAVPLASSSAPGVEETGGGNWVWPIAGSRTVIRPFETPASRYSAGHRGIDIAARPGDPVLAPESGTVRFAGVVVDRPTVTVETSQGVLISIEPLITTVAVGDAVTRGDALGVVGRGGHCDGTCIHLGVRVAGEYVSPMRFFGGVPRAVLLPLH